jgi:hypothetical protein
LVLQEAADLAYAMKDISGRRRINHPLAGA